MSTWRPYAVRCPCGATLRAELADGLHVAETPWVRARIAAGDFQRLACPACGVARVAHTPLVYTDFARLHWVVVAPPAELAAWGRWAGLCAQQFEKHVRRTAPPFVQALADRFTVRLVFGLDALAEKLRAWDAGLDDRLVEAVKLSLLGGLPGGPTPGLRLRLQAVDRGAWTLSFTVSRPGRDAQDVITLSLDAYLDAEARAPRLRSELPALFTPPFCALDAHFAALHAAAWAAEPRLEVLGELPEEAARA